MNAYKYEMTRTVTKEECSWLKNKILVGTIVYGFIGATYGCITDTGIACTFSADGSGEFFEVPQDAIRPYSPASI